MVALGALATTANAALIYPDILGTNGGEFNTSFALANLTNAGHSAATDTESADANTGGYATANGPTNAVAGSRVVLTLDFNSAVSLDTFYLWNHTFNGGATAPDNGVDNFTLTFFDGVAGAGSQIGSVYTGDAAAAVATGNYAAEQFAFSSTYAGVRSVVLNVIDDQGNDTTGFVGIRELAFNSVVVPEPSSTALLSLGGLALILRRRK